MNSRKLQPHTFIMKLFWLAAIVTIALVVNVSAEEKYTTKYDNINIDEILNSERLFKNYHNCLVDKGSCTPDVRELKKDLPDALQTECSKCSDVQKKTADKVIKFIRENKKDEWKELIEKYDPEHKYEKRYEANHSQN
ncbi:ejaculatory bulb-specific protein 3-like isoform X1 [Stomoxys calcitrans]|nr:ejaculatory bulb-specific protein 3-like isoform X1 [Stomoxys calcitrans]